MDTHIPLIPLRRTTAFLDNTMMTQKAATVTELCTLVSLFRGSNKRHYRHCFYVLRQKRSAFSEFVNLCDILVNHVEHDDQRTLD